MLIVGLADESMTIKWSTMRNISKNAKLVIAFLSAMSSLWGYEWPREPSYHKGNSSEEIGGPEVQKDLQRLAKLIACPMPALEVPLVRVGTLPVKTIATDVGRIVSVSK